MKKLLVGCFVLFACAGLVQAATYTHTYYADGADHFMNVYLDSGGTHTFAVNGVPWGSYNYEAYKNTGSGYYSIWSDSTSTGRDPSFSTYATPGYTVKLVIYDGSWNVKSVYYWNIYEAPKADLIAYSVSLSDTTVNRGQSVTVNWTAKNQGGGDAGSTQQGVMWSGNSTISRSDSLLEREYLGSMSSGNTDPESHGVTIPSDAMYGATYYIGVYADYDLDEDEDDESNNGSSGVAVTINDNRSDLIAYSVSVSDTTVTRGQTITVNWTAKNQGSGSAGSTQQGVMWSGNSTISRSDSLLEREYLGSMSSGNTDPESHGVTIPSDAMYGATYYIGVYADYDEDEDESNESNNDSSAVAVTIVDDRPDLTADFISVSDTTVTRGQSVTVNWTARNQGAGNAGSTQQGVMWSDNSSISISDDLLEREYLGSMSSGNTTPESHGVTIPSDATYGATYYIGVYADYDGDEAESNESNNGDGTPVAVTVVDDRPDLYVRDIQTSKTSVRPGESIRIDSWTKNQGLGVASQSRVEYYLGRSAGEKWQYIGYGLVPNVGSLDPDEESQDTISSYDIPYVADGDYYIVVEADANGDIAESDEGNNIRSEVLTIANVTGASITAFTPQTGLIDYGATGTVSVTIQNTGTTTRTFWVGLSFSGPSSGTWPDGWMDVPPQETGTLSPSDTQTFVFEFEIPGWLPTGQYTAHTAIWDDYNETDDLMVEPQYDYQETSSFLVSGNYPQGTDDDPYGLIALDAGGFYEDIPVYNRGSLSDLESHIANPLQDARTATALDSADDRVVVLIHGWNPDKRIFGFGDPPSDDPLHDGEWVNVTTQLEGSKLDSEWSLVEYDWHNDAQTGFGFIGKSAAAAATADLRREPGEPETTGAGALAVRLAIMVQAMAAEKDAAEAAERAYAHGIVLGKNLVDQSEGNLKQVQLIGHSAGSWGVYSALRYLAQHVPACEVQVTYLDPYIPDEAGWYTLKPGGHFFSSTVLENCVNYTDVTTSGAAEAEAYYTDDDFTEVFSLLSDATTVNWTWNSVPSAYVKLTGSGEFGNYAGHGGPIEFYGDSVANPALAAVDGMGWNYSLAFNTTVDRIIRLVGDLAFGDVLSGSSANRTFTIHNDGNDPLNVSSIIYPSRFSGNWNSGTIGAGGAQNVVVSFNPSAVDSYNGTVTVNCNKTSGTNTLSCSGRGVLPEIQLKSDNNYTIPEGGLQQLGVRLSREPAENTDVSVSITSGSSIFSGSPSYCRFTISNWNTWQYFSVSASEDDNPYDDSGSVQFSASGLSNKSHELTQADNDSESIIANPATLNITEGQTRTFSVRLNAQPLSGVTVFVLHSGDTDISHNPALLQYTTENWNSVQYVTVSVSQDADTLDETATFNCTSSGWQTDSVAVTALDDDFPHITIQTDPLVIPEGGTSQQTVTLTLPPESPIEFNVIRETGDTNITVSGGSWTLSSANYDTGFTFPVSATHDIDVVDGLATCRVSAVEGSGINSATFTARENDDDVLAILTRNTPVSVQEGSKASFDISLDHQPGNDVVISTTRTSGDTDISVISGGSRTFTPTNWNQWQAVTLQAVEDVDDLDGSSSFTCTSPNCPSNTIVSATEHDDDKDFESPTIQITTPTTGNRVTVRTNLLNIAGTASDNDGVSLVRVRNDRDGVVRPCTGTTQWSFIGLPLFPGRNQITATAYDSSDNTGTDTLTVFYVLKEPVNDFDGDGYSDMGGFNPDSGNWRIMGSTDGEITAQFGYRGTVPITGDFDGDGKTDYGCYDATGLFSNGEWLAEPGSWYVMRSADGFGTETFGYGGTIPFTGDFDGDGSADFGCYDPSGLFAGGEWLAQPGSWYIMQGTAGFRTETFGYGGTVPIVGDFDGDGNADFGCYDAAGLFIGGQWLAQPGSWYIMQSTAGFRTETFGYGGTVPVVGDFDGDGSADFGCYDAAGLNAGGIWLAQPGSWYIMQSTAGFRTEEFGYHGTTPVVGDYDGDGIDDFGCYDPDLFRWYIMQSTDGFTVEDYGSAGALPLGAPAKE